MIYGAKLYPLPEGTGPVMTLSHGRDNPDGPNNLVILSIGRPEVEETENGELVSSISMSIPFAIATARRILFEVGECMDPDGIADYERGEDKEEQ